MRLRLVKQSLLIQAHPLEEIGFLTHVSLASMNFVVRFYDGILYSIDRSGLFFYSLLLLVRDEMAYDQSAYAAMDAASGVRHAR